MVLKPADADFMLRILPLPDTLRRRLEDFLRLGLPLAPEQKSELRELVADQLQLQGFGPNNEITPIGHRLEDLIDALFIDESAA